MANFFYLDGNSKKQGPVSQEQLKFLAQQGVIRPETQLETDGGYKGTAVQIQGLFPAATNYGRTSSPANIRTLLISMIILGIIYAVMPFVSPVIDDIIAEWLNDFDSYYLLYERVVRFIRAAAGVGFVLVLAKVLVCINNCR